MPERKIKRALISVYDKTGIVDFARALADDFGVEIISTGGTAALLTENHIAVTLVEEITGFPEMMDGRVKTLHPKIHAAILADRDNPEHMRQLEEQGIEPIDMVVVNLYPFEQTVADPNCTFEQAIEMIDIGGPCLLRAAAKNHKHVWVLQDPRVYRSFLGMLANMTDEAPNRRSLACAAFLAASKYNARIAEWLSVDETSRLSQLRFFHLRSMGELRYGENPHQHGEVLGASADLWPSEADILSSALHESAGQMSFNNYVDASSALELCNELTREPPLSGTGFQPVRKRETRRGLEPLTVEKHTRRNLPHIQTPGKTYFVTFRLRSGELTPAERDIVLSACLHWAGEKIEVHAAVIMPDHVHLLFTPRETSPGKWVSLGEIMYSVKRHSAGKINTLRGTSGALWQDEYFDRIIRNQKEYEETRNYMANNAVRTGLVDAEEYPWFWDEIEHSKTHRLETGAPQPQPQESRSHTPKEVQACVFVKHTNACGVGIAEDPLEAYQRAYLGDPNAAMGGVLACNFNVDRDFAEAVMETYDRWGKKAGAGGFFVEVWIAPHFDGAAVDIIKAAKKWGRRVRLLAVGDVSASPDEDALEYKTIAGGMLVQTRDLVGLNEDQWKVVTRRQPTDAELNDLRLAWLVCKHTKSNAITICKDGTLIGNGAGQMSRVMSCRIATWLARENGHADELTGSVAASDAFFPFPDAPNILIDAGARAIIQPGGSKRDGDTIAACDERGVAMIFTATRHFRH